MAHCWKLLGILLVPALCGCAGAPPPQRVDVSLVNLLTNPDEFSERPVAVHGYLSDLGNGTSLALTRDHAEMGDRQSAVRIANERLPSACKSHYVVLWATFEPVDDDRGFEFADVRRVVIVQDEKPFTCYEER